MDSQENFNLTVGKNLVAYRKLNNLTQLDIAEKLNYSDKAISKWERGECLPDAYTLYQIATLYGVTVNDLFKNETNPKKTTNKKLSPFFITLLSSSLVWILATLIFVLLKLLLPLEEKQWLAFIIAIPVNFIVLIVFSSIYHSKLWQIISVSGLVWTAILVLDLLLKPFNLDTWLFYFIGIPLQIAIIFWYTFKWYLKRKKL